MGRKQKNDHPRSSDRKTLQLCRQVQRALSFAISETGDERLLSVYVESVEPHPDAGHMMVQVGNVDEPAAVLEALHENTGRLRTAVAHAITRRKAPELFFRIVPVEPD